MRDWAHHYRTDTLDDPVFRAAMRGYDSVSFVFSLEVTWSKIQKRQQEKEDQKALEELLALQELQEGNDEDGGVITELEDFVKNSPDQGGVQDSEIVVEDRRYAKESSKATFRGGTSLSMELEDSEAKRGSNDDDPYNDALLHVDGVDDDQKSNEVAREDVEIVAPVKEQLITSSDGYADGSVTETQSSSVSSPRRFVCEIPQDAQMVSTLEEGSPAADQQYWDCRQCTYKNSISMRKCDVCKARRPKTEGGENAKSRGTKRARDSQ
jgi:hypothetical protein